jgi:hypothetical protein
MSDTLATVAATPSATAAPAPSQRVTPGTPEWAALTTEQRHSELRGPANPRARGHSPARDHREAVAAQATGQDAPAATPDGEPQAPPAAPADGTKFKVGRYEVSEDEVASMLDRQSQDDLRRLTLPQAPTDYRAELPEGLTLPGGQTYKFDANDPSLVAARNWAHAKGLSQDDFSQVLGIYASHVVGQEALLTARSRAEVEKAGSNAPQRAAAVGRWITGEVGDADAKPILATIVTDSHLRFYEKMMNKIASQGAASFSQSHRVPPETAGIPGYDKMSFEQRRQAQDTLAARRR